MIALTTSEPSAAAPPSQLTETGLEPATNRDRHISLGFEAYRPIRPLAGKARAENLLWHSLVHAGLLDAWDDPLHAIQRELGRDHSIFGVHLPAPLAQGLAPAAMSWELRLLDHDADGSTFARVRAALEPWIELAPGVDELPPHVVLGLRFDATTMASGAIEAVEIHLRGEDARRIEVRRRSAEADELVSRDFLVEAKRQIDELLPAIKTSEFVDFASDAKLLGRVMIPELFACRRVHVSKRPHCDALIFSGVNVEQLRFTYERFEHPEPMRAFLIEHQAKLEHLLFDVGVEYRTHEGRVVYATTSFYACF